MKAYLLSLLLGVAAVFLGYENHRLSQALHEAPSIPGKVRPLVVLVTPNGPVFAEATETLVIDDLKVQLKGVVDSIDKLNAQPQPKPQSDKGAE